VDICLEMLKESATRMTKLLSNLHLPPKAKEFTLPPGSKCKKKIE